MHYLFFSCLIVFHHALLSNIEDQLHELNNQLQSLTKSIPEEITSHAQPKIHPKWNSCAKELLDLPPDNYDLLFTTARYTPFRNSTQEPFPLGIILEPLLSLDDIDKASDKNYQEFYILAKDDKDETGYIMHQMVIFRFQLSTLEQYTWAVPYLTEQHNPNAELTDELKPMYADILTVTSGKTKAVAMNMNKEINDIHQMRPDQFASQLMELPAEIRKKFTLNKMRGLLEAFIQYLQPWQKIKSEDKALAKTIENIAAERGLKMRDDFAVLYRNTHWGPDEPPAFTARFGIPKRRDKESGGEIIDIFDKWYDVNLVNFLESLQRYNSSKQFKKMFPQSKDLKDVAKNFNIILKPPLNSEEIYQLIAKKYKQFSIEGSKDADCLILQIKKETDGTWHDVLADEK